MRSTALSSPLSGEGWWLLKRGEIPLVHTVHLPRPGYQQSLVSAPVEALIPVLVSVKVVQSPSDACFPPATGVAVRVKVVAARAAVIEYRLESVAIGKLTLQLRLL